MKIVLTGAAGYLGGLCRAPLAALCDTLVSTDIADGITDLLPNESYRKVDIGVFDQVHDLLAGADMVVHFGSIADEAAWEKIFHSNLLSAYNIWESAHQQGVRRIVFASSIHAVGMHPKQTAIGIDAAHRPDTYYGLAKCFTEDLASLYWDKRGLETVCMRIASATPKPGNSRALGTWLSEGDAVQLVEKCVTSPTVGFSIVYGVSNNDRAGVDNSGAAFLGFRPKDNAEDYAADILPKADPQDPQNPEDMCHGGPFAVVPLGTSGVEMIKARNVSKD
ncbi:uronate dehydrogenase [Cognatiyoonia koreensis]|uniref:Uronate dehydrogenase n=1 Tax=Cognatiyoonia koreensis TaxID=364200 RepID=A0A1I0RJA5_9RHOB|nr:NAD(P)-dependent oxidoreductase [Cognatiyoonia koreensis]SEW41088.1 uronate dehydrogenase [Cognatiyoonia koreensis]